MLKILLPHDHVPRWWVGGGDFALMFSWPRVHAGGSGYGGGGPEKVHG